MKADYLSFKRATSVCLLGLAIQLVLGLILLIYSVITRDHAALTAALYVLTGIVVWLSLAVVYDQHRRERLEALEADSLKQGSSVFEESGDELRVAARRVAWMHKYMLPGVSLALAALLIGVGYWRLAGANGGLFWIKQEMDPTKAPPRGWPIALGLILAFVGFVFARYVSGMAKQKVWANLRAGAAQAVGGAIMGLGMVIAQFVSLAGPDVVLRYIHVIFPGLMIVLGAEIVLNFVLTIYRPRKTGEIPRPAYDSRILGFVAAPDRIAESIGGAINYQFGFDVTGSWFYQLLSRSITALVLVGAVVVWAMTWVAVVQPDEQGLRLRNGRLVGEALRPGAYLKWPWPFEKVERQRVAAPIRVDLAGPSPGDVKSLLWTNEHKVKEKQMIVQPAAAEAAIRQTTIAGAPPDQKAGGAPADQKSSVVKDVSLINIEVPVFYRITDAVKFDHLAQDGMQDRILQALGRREVMTYLATRSMDDVLGSGRIAASDEMRKLVEKKFKEQDAGVEVLFVGIEGVHPPLDTAFDFESVVQSEQNRLGAIEAAHTEETTTLTQAVGSVALARRIVQEIGVLDKMDKTSPNPESLKQQQKIEDLLAAAGGQAAITIQRAKADRWTKHMGVRGQSERYAGQLAAYRAAPTVYTAQLYFDMLASILKGARVYIVPDKGVEVRTNLEDVLTGGSAFQKALENPQ